MTLPDISFVVQMLISPNAASMLMREVLITLEVEAKEVELALRHFPIRYEYRRYYVLHLEETNNNT